MNSYMYDDDSEEDYYEQQVIEEYYDYFQKTEEIYWNERCSRENNDRILSGDWQ